MCAGTTIVRGPGQYSSASAAASAGNSEQTLGASATSPRRTGIDLYLRSFLKGKEPLNGGRDVNRRGESIDRVGRYRDYLPGSQGRRGRDDGRGIVPVKTRTPVSLPIVSSIKV